MNKIRILARWGRTKSKRSELIRYRLHEELIDYVNALVPSLLLIALGLVVYEFGFHNFWANHHTINFWLRNILVAVTTLSGLRLFFEIFTKKRWKARLFNVLGFLVAVIITFYILPQKMALQNWDTNRFLLYKIIIDSAILFGFITESSRFVQFLYSRTINPGILFVGSFVMLIILGAFLLKVPNATYERISTLDAIFTSTSAVCVTGLMVVDITNFTPFGHAILLVLFQVGGLGFMTLTGLLAYAMAGESSFKTQLAFSSLMSSRKVNNIMHFIYQVVFVTLLSEVIGTAFIYFSLDDALFARKMDKLYFSVYHAVSAFCNAGFSTNGSGLYEPGFRFNYLLQFIIALLVILGGMGFPILFNLYRFINIKLSNLARRISRSPKRTYFPNVIMLNSRLALAVSSILLAFGFVAYMLFEQNHTLAQHPTIIGKIVTCFFGSVTPRTAGFNTIDLGMMGFPMIMIYLLLMWIGASPGSTGGGIKTTTAGVAFLNMMSVLQGKDRTEFFRSEISHLSVRRAFAIIVSSLLVMGIATFLVSFNDSDKGLINIAFEVFAAFSTAGMTFGITPDLALSSRVVLMITMFVGRVGTITLLVIFIRQSKKLYYRYPKEDIAF